MIVEDVIIIVQILIRIIFPQVSCIIINQFLSQAFICFPSIESVFHTILQIALYFTHYIFSQSRPRDLIAVTNVEFRS